MKRAMSMVVATSAIFLVLGLGAVAIAGRGARVRDSTGEYKYKPTTLKFEFPALAPPFKITKIRHWFGWTPARIAGGFGTKAEGWLHYDDCKPNCASGHYKRRRAHFQLSRLHGCGRHHRRLVYGQIAIKPRGLPRHSHRIGCSGLLRN